jgi:protein SCO1
MKTNPTFSTNKIIALVMFVSAAIITSLFMFHLHYKPKQLTLSSNEATLFPTARDLKSFELTSDKKSFTQKDFYGHWTLLFFGFTHCSNVCPTTLDMMNRAYSNLHQQLPNLQVVLVSLDPDRDTPLKLASYARSFNPDFIGVTGELKEIRKLQSQMGVYSAREPGTPETNYQLQHTSSIMLINPQGKWAGLFNFGMKPAQFADLVKESVTLLS